MAHQTEGHATQSSDPVPNWESLFDASHQDFQKLESSIACECASCCGAIHDLENNGSTMPSSESDLRIMPEFTLEEIASQLTTGYWSAVANGASRAFDVSDGQVLYVDLSGLREGGQGLARQALDAWSAISGLRFVELVRTGNSGTIIDEVHDAAAGTSTNYRMALGDIFDGTLSTGRDRDSVAIDLVAGKSYTVSLRGDHTGGSGTLDPYLRLLNFSGNLVAQNDDAENRDSRLTFTAPHTGTYYVQAGSYQDNYAGDYRIEVVEAYGHAHITFGDQGSGAYSTSNVVGNTIISSHVNVNWNWSGGTYRTDGHHFQTYLHEIGHALGLGHAGNYNGSALFGRDNHYANDSWALSVMSYFDQQENSYTSSSFAYAITPMLSDILAIQSLYGAPDTLISDSTYGVGANTGTYLDDALNFTAPTAWVVSDTGGTDHFDFSSYIEDQIIDLREGRSSDIGGLTGNVSIAFGTLIENATSGAGNDMLIGNSGNNDLRAGEGADTVHGEDGDDRVFGGHGRDVISGGNGRDSLSGDDGEDLLVGGDGVDFLMGGGGNDVMFGDDITLAELQDIFPTWMPSNAAMEQIAAGELHLVWESIQADIFCIA